MNEFSLLTASTDRELHVKELGLTTELALGFLFPQSLAKDGPMDLDLERIVEGMEDRGLLLCEVTVANADPHTYLFIRLCTGEMTMSEFNAVWNHATQYIVRFHRYPDRGIRYAFANDSPIFNYEGFARPSWCSVCTIGGMRDALRRRKRPELMKTRSMTYRIYRPSGEIACLV